MPRLDSHINKLNEDAKKSMSSRILVGLLIGVVGLPLVLLGDYAFLALVLFALGVSGYEILLAGKTKYKNNVITIIITYFTLFLPVILTCIINNLLNSQPLYDLSYGFSSFIPGFLGLVIIVIFNLFLAIFDKDFTIEQAFYYITMETVIVFGSLSLLHLRYYPIFEEIIINPSFNTYTSTLPYYFRFGTSAMLLLYVVLGAMANDICAYFFGVLFGKHKMCPRISPKKTWEGFAGGIIGSAAITMTFVLLLANFDYPIIQSFDLNHWYLILITSIIIPLIGTLGDLIFSLVKRNFGVKDFGTMLKSHGGILDRLDSIYFTAIVGALIVSLITLF